MIVEQSLPASPMAAVRILMVAEKPRLAKSIARTLSNNSYDTWSELIGNTKSKKPVTSRVYEFDGEFQEKPAKFTITSTYGHLMDMDFYPEYNNWRRTTPEYIKNQLYTAPVKKVKRNPLRGIHEHLAKEAKDKDCLILWLDPDNEGENICFEVIYTVMGHMNISEDMKNVFRARLSSLAPDDITSAFHNLERPNMYKSWVVDVRRELDFRIGCAITRLFTIHIKPLFDKLKTEQLSYGPCQTPILGLCVGRHKEITNFKKESYWVLKAKFVSNKSPMEMQFSTGKINDKDTAQRLFGKIKDRGFGEVIKVEKKTKRDDPPCALNSPELMRAINKLYGTMPKDAMDFLEKLYLNEYVTYPRTGRTDYPQSFDIKDCLEKIARGNIEYKTARKLLESDITPVFNQTNSDQHDLSPIVPMNPYFGDVAPSENKKQIIGYVVKHFLATLMKPCDYEITTVTVQLGDETFTTTGVEVIEKGYTELFTWKAVKTKRIADVKKGDRLQLIAINRDEKCTAPPEHLTVSEIITAMVENNIGTNGSIATHIHSICDKGYVTIIDNRRLKPTKLGIALIDSFNNAAPELVYTELRRAIEEKLANAINPNKNSSYKTFDEIKYKTHVKEVFKEYKKILVDLIDNINEAVKAFEVHFGPANNKNGI